MYILVYVKIQMEPVRRTTVCLCIYVYIYICVLTCKCVETALWYNIARAICVRR